MLVPARLDLAALRAVGPDEEVPDLLRGLVRVPVRRAAAPAATEQPSGADLRSRLAAAHEGERRHILLDLVRATAAAVLGFADKNEVEAHRGFLELGLNSLTAVELRNRLGAAAGLTLPVTVMFDHPSAGEMAGFLGEQLLRDQRPEGSQATVHGDLDRIEASLAGGVLDEQERDAVTARLQELLAKFGDGSGGGAGRSALADQLADVSDDDLFDIIDNGLGTLE
ncbi:hypothetical protein BLA24_12310 [Streptomyces cinnamoneus]|uniref:Carrier domain-containing protein n=1 Tax=Streptomyces cinnamoneus TaxID=53446 RepID=A0A2G1XKW5_STRCJ|nr:hypothetical protein BLA24_12310 [Streptomyces cinnamoneus]